jgi:hypothetical protein
MEIASNQTDNNIAIIQMNTEVADRKKELNRARQARHYQKHKEEINQARRANTALLSQLKKQKEPEPEQIPVPEPEPEPISQTTHQPLKPIKKKVKKTKKLVVEEEPEPEPEVIMIKKTKKSKLPKVIDLEKVFDLLQGLRDSNVIKTDGTLKKYEEDTKRLMKLTKCDNLLDCLKDPKEISKIIDDSSYAINTKKSLYQSVVFLIDNLKLPYSVATFNDYKKHFEIYKGKSTEEGIEKTYESLITFPEYLKLVKEKWGENSKMYLLGRLYDQVTMRDDFQLMIVSKSADVTDDKNYLVVPKTGQLKVVMNVFKTSNKYKIEPIRLDESLSQLLREFMKKNNLKPGDYLFGSKKLTSYISNNNQLIGVKGGTNTYRHMKTTEILSDPDLTEEQRIEVSLKMAHSPISQLKYVRNKIK